MTTDRIEFLDKYANSAKSLLEQKYGQNFTDADVEKLAFNLIKQDAEITKVAELVESAQVMAGGFYSELKKNEAELLKTAGPLFSKLLVGLAGKTGTRAAMVAEKANIAKEIATKGIATTRKVIKKNPLTSVMTGVVGGGILMPHKGN